MMNTNEFQRVCKKPYYDMKILLISSGEKLQILLQYCQDLLPTFIIEGNVEFQLKVSENNVFQVFRPLKYDLTHDSLLVLNTVDWPLIILTATYLLPHPPCFLLSRHLLTFGPSYSSHSQGLCTCRFFLDCTLHPFLPC